MDYEKKYNEALDRARNLMAMYPQDAPGYKEVFPELRESEDERITRAINNMLPFIPDEAYANNGVTKEDVLNYLEKQKETHYTKRNALFDKCVAECDPAVMKEVSDEIDEMLEKEHKPASTEDMPYITDEHFYEREPVDSFKYKLAEYMTRCCTKKEGQYGYEYGISAETILKMAEEELLKRGVVQKPAEWSDEDEDMLNSCISSIEEAKENRYAYKETDGDTSYDHEIDWLKSLRPSWKSSEVCYGAKGDPDPAGVWKPSEEQMNLLLNIEGILRKRLQPVKATQLAELYEQLKKLKGGVAPMRDIDE